MSPLDLGIDRGEDADVIFWMRREHRPANAGLNEALEHPLDLIDVALGAQLRRAAETGKAQQLAPRLHGWTAASSRRHEQTFIFPISATR